MACRSRTGPGAPTQRVQRLRRIVQAVLDGTVAPGSQDAGMLRYLASNPSGSGPSRFAIVLAALCQAPMRSRPGRRIWASEDIARWFDTAACSQLPPCREFSATAASPKTPVKRVEVYGTPAGTTGLGTNARMMLRTLKQIGVPHVAIDTGHGRGIADPTGAQPGSHPLTRQVVLHQVNADRVPLHMMSPRLARRNAPYHIGFLLWELDRIPPCHRLGAEMLDEIWAPSGFVRDLYSRETATPVHLVKKGLMHLDALRGMSAEAGDDPDRFTALVCFDFHSGVERKNPLAAVRAFQIAFPARRYRHCRLIVKTTPTAANHWGDPRDQMGQIRQLASRDPRINIVEAFVPQTQLWRMMQAADCIISPHRAEGFGYIPAYALALARPLITTDYGGTRDFCDAGTCFPVAAALTAVPAGHALYFPAGARWADVAPDALAGGLRQVHDNPGDAAERGRTGQRRIARDYSIPTFAARCRDRLQQIGALQADQAAAYAEIRP